MASYSVVSPRYVLASLQFAIGLAISTGAHCAGSEFIVGVGTHFGQARTDLDSFFSWVDRSAFTSLRDEMYWSDVEQAKGTFALGSKSGRTLQAFQRAKALGIQPLLILSYGNHHYEGGTQPATPEGRAAFARYAGWVAQTTQSQVPLYEVWNEWNIGSGNRPPARYGDPANYVELTRAAYKAIKQVNPEAAVLGGALGDDLPNWPWLSRAIDAGLLDTVDGISVHLYNYSAPISKAGASEFIERLEMLNQLLNKKSKSRSIPIYVTEVGWPNDETPKGVSLRDAAVQGQIFLLAARSIPNLKGIWFYEFRDGGMDPSNKEHHFGLTTINGRDKPLACIIKSTHATLKDAELTWKSSTEGVNSQLYTKPDGQKIIAAWSSQKSPLGHNTVHTINGYFPSPPTRVDGAGCVTDNTSAVLKSSKTSLTIALTDAPILLQLATGSTVKKP